MAGPFIYDAVLEKTSTTGTGDIGLDGQEPGGFFAFGAVLNDNDTFPYTLQDATNSDREVGIGTYHTATNRFTRTTVLKSTNSNSAVNLKAGSKDVFIDLPASYLQPLFAPSASLIVGRATAGAGGMEQLTL